MQFGHDVLHEIRIGTWHVRRGDHEPVARPLCKERFEYVGGLRVEWAAVDPQGTMPLDVNRLNNSRMREAGTRGIIRVAGRWGFWFQNLLHVLTGL